jgi:hypothetical protein
METYRPIPEIEPHMDQLENRPSPPPEAVEAPPSAAELPPAKERPNVELDFDQLEPGSRLDGATGSYEFTAVSPLLKEEGSLLECRVTDESGKEFFLHNKNAEQQVLASLIGEHLLPPVEGHQPLVSYPEMRLETINGQDTALMEFFADHEELDPEANELTPEQKAHLNTVNLWLGNSDFKEDHVLVDSATKHHGLIDFDRAFDFNNRDRLSDTAFKMPFLDDGVPAAAYQAELARLQALGPDDQAALLERAVDRGVNPERVQKLLDQLFARRGAVAEELQTVQDLHAAQKKLDEEMFG